MKQSKNILKMRYNEKQIPANPKKYIEILKTDLTFVRLRALMVLYPLLTVFLRCEQRRNMRKQSPFIHIGKIQVIYVC